MSSASAPWFGAARDEWLTAVSAWIRDALAVTGRPLVALETLSERPWGYVARALSNDEQCHGGSSDDVVGAQREIATLLRTWLAKSHVLGDPQQLLMPATA